MSKKSKVFQFLENKLVFYILKSDHFWHYRD